MKALICFLVVAFFFVGVVALKGDNTSDETELKLEGAKFPSPNGKLTATIEQEEDGWYHLKIKDAATGKVDDSQLVQLTPVFSAHWTGDSTTFVTVGHIAHGSTATFFRHDENGWSTHNFEPVTDFDDDPHYDRVCFEVKKIQANEHSVTLTYIITPENFSKMDNGESPARYLLTQRVDTATGHVDHQEQKRLK